jgi:predicted ferric reductase
MNQATLFLASPQKATVYWFVARGSGFVVFGLLTVAVCLGLLLALRWRTDAWPRMITEELHPFVLIVAAVFLCLHVVSVFLDTFIHFQWYQVLIPFTSSYRVVWLSLGIIAMYLGAALALSIYLRPFIGYRAWRTMHYAGFLAWILALTHGLTMGTDAGSPWAIALYGGSALLVVGLLAIRFGGVPRTGSRVAFSGSDSGRVSGSCRSVGPGMGNSCPESALSFESITRRGSLARGAGIV